MKARPTFDNLTDPNPANNSSLAEGRFVIALATSLAMFSEAFLAVEATVSGQKVFIPEHNTYERFAAQFPDATAEIVQKKLSDFAAAGNDPADHSLANLGFTDDQKGVFLVVVAKVHSESEAQNLSVAPIMDKFRDQLDRGKTFEALYEFATNGVGPGSRTAAQIVDTFVDGIASVKAAVNLQIPRVPPPAV